MAVLKQIVAQYPYEDDKGQSLKTEAAALGIQLASGLQSRVSNAGVKIVAFNMTDLSYAPEIAQAMLVRQQAEAMVKVRQTHTNTLLLLFLFLSVAPPNRKENWTRPDSNDLFSFSAYCTGSQADCEGSGGYFRRCSGTIAVQRRSDVSSRENESGHQFAHSHLW